LSELFLAPLGRTRTIDVSVNRDIYPLILKAAGGDEADSALLQ